MGVNLDVTDNGKLRVVSSQDFITTSEFEQLKNSKTEVVSYLNHQKAESLVSCFKQRADRVFVRNCLVEINGNERLEVVNKYLEQWQQGSDGEPISFKKDNAGRYQANTWLRKSFGRNQS
jgi:2,3-bisphosphoglycerate-independent phosphoglycerate mutase